MTAAETDVVSAAVFFCCYNSIIGVNLTGERVSIIISFAKKIFVNIK